ncbi:hypothetical protein JOB18_026414 [Solea senegalensis]|uniref:SPIN-DOC-like zinc-finger domain-containing protein n=1 Tax=Solea senegalensis TaxID=28829 RepID=A0AAV6QTW0_SOLSE|nr:uncharacterized protein si:dkey-28a3.2 [Solea senegalensis]XP_043877198.1 uncharacterized protein si:dkey-28a3.2 [Solea senegalensis]XP_043877199.1 uncharacterized protein si:dkey-28a3.2 [Solea senegalensis]KAG7496856.1 hypothetical protein JOB18_026414 [Solea senegalensis]
MPTAKDKGGAAPHHYRPASRYDDATLAQKREYWRTKKREQRARRSDRRGRSTQSSRGEQRRHLNTPAVVNSSLSGSFAAPSPPVWNNAELYTSASATPASQNLCDSAEIQKKKWIQHPVTLNTVLTQMPASCSDTATATAKCRATRRAVNKAITSPTPTKTQLNTNSSVPPVRTTRITNGSCAQTTPQPLVSMQGTSVPNMQHKKEDALHTQPIFVKAEDANATPQSGTQSALVTSQRAEGVCNSKETEEEKAAKRREQWRIKKREQRAKLAAQLGKARERMLGAEMLRQTAQKTGLPGAVPLRNLSSQSFLKAAGQRQCPTRGKATFTPGKRENYKLQTGAGRLATVNLQVNVQNPNENRTITSDGTSVKKPGELLRKYPSYTHLSNISRGMVRCKTPRQRFIDAQRNFFNLRNMRCKSPFFTSVFASRNIPRIDPNDTPEQIIAKRREYWRIKKREQRAKLSMEMKSRLKEKDSLMRRVKRYQSILEEMRRARALAQSAGSTLTDASETIGGFIEEDGTVTIKIPQSPMDHNTAAHTSNKELHVSSNNSPFAQRQYHPNTKRRGIVPIRTKQPPQVKVSLPGQSINKPPKLLSVRPRTSLRSTTPPNSQALPNQAVGQLTLTRPTTSQNAISGGLAAGSNLDGCVMKMAISSGTAVSPSALSLDPSLTEEERMAKKREYWRIKKREQRAARAVRLKQGVLQARVNAALQRRRAQKQFAASTVHLNRRLTNPPGSARPLSVSSVPVTPNANEIKQETVPEVHLHSQPEQTICADIKCPTSPPPPPPPPLQPDSDPALSAESQATTLLAVASMKKLLEESLSTVRESECEPTDIKTETEEEPSEQEMKPILPQLFFEKDEVAPLAADLTLQIKSWQPDNDALVQADSPSPHFKESPPFSETPSPIPASSEEILPPTCEHSSQTPSNFIVTPSMEASGVPAPLRRTQRICSKKVSCSPEPPKLHHIAASQLHPQAQHVERHAKERCQKSNRSSAQKCSSLGAEHGGLTGLTSLQRKREYWKLMKRQQRARSKARQKDRHGHGEFSRRTFHTDIQVPGAFTSNSVRGLNPPSKRAQHVSSLGANTHVAPVPVATSTTCQSPDPLTSVSCSLRSKQNNKDFGPSQIMSDSLGAPETKQQASLCSQEWLSTSTDEDTAPSLPTLKPPDNPLSSINLQPIEPQGPTLSPLKIPCPQLPSPSRMIQSPCTLASVSAMAPPKRIPGEPEEDFLRRKREYWRVKKKEQRARKAVQVKGASPRRAANNWRPIIQSQELVSEEVMVNREPDYDKSQDCSQWVNSSESEPLMSSPANTGSFPFPNYTSIEDESEILFPDYEHNDGDDGSVSDDVWRNRFLMDYDPLNQLLVCMVCGELQYSHSLEGVRAHIEDAHPDTLALEARDRQGILEAWDEQVSQRERFFTSQLQQHSGSLTETQENR